MNAATGFARRGFFVDGRPLSLVWLAWLATTRIRCTGATGTR
jgi:hypothetical protein